MFVANTNYIKYWMY